MMISCKKAAELVCQSLDRRLTLYERIRLRFHVWMCRGCMAFCRQCHQLNEMFRKRFATPVDPEDARRELDRLPESACERLKQRLREAARQQS